jgi:hypothetical protein
MYPELQKELAVFERRTPKSAESHKKNLKRIPLGVAIRPALAILKIVFSLMFSSPANCLAVNAPLVRYSLAILFVRVRVSISASS